MMTLLRKTSALALVMGAAGFMIPSAALTSGPGENTGQIVQWDEPRLPETVTTAPVWTDLGTGSATGSTTSTVEFPIRYESTSAPTTSYTVPVADYTSATAPAEPLATPTYEYGEVPVSQATSSGYHGDDRSNAVSGYGSVPVPIHRNHGDLHQYTSPFYGNSGCGSSVPSCGAPVYSAPAPVYTAPAPVYHQPQIVHQPPRIVEKVVYRDRPIYRDRPVWRDRIVEKKVFVDRPVYVNRRVVVDRPIYVNRQVPVDRPVYVERKVPVPVHVRVPVDRPVYVEKRVPVPVPRPYAVPVDRPVYVERRVPVPVHIRHQVNVPVDRPVYVERRVPVPVPRPYPVQTPVYVQPQIAPVVTATTNGCYDPCAGYGGAGHGAGLNHGWGAGAVSGYGYGAEFGHGAGYGHGGGYGINPASFGTGYEGFGAPLAYPGFDPYVQQLSSQISAASVKISEGEKEQTLSDREAGDLRKKLQKVMNELDEARKDGKVDHAEIAKIARHLDRLTAELHQKRINLETANVPFGPYGPAAHLGYAAPQVIVPAHTGGGGYFPGAGFHGGFGGYNGFYGAPAKPQMGKF